MKKKPQRAATETITISVPVGIKELVKKEAKAENRNVSSYLNNLLSNHLGNDPDKCASNHINAALENERKQTSANQSEAAG